MRLGLTVNVAQTRFGVPMDIVLEAERLGFDSVWTSEAWGSDAVSPAAWILARTERIRVGTAIMQYPARTPAMTAMTAMTLDQLSGGRFILGLGPSGPQVVEGWHGVPYAPPLGRFREYVAIVRRIMRREGPVSFAGEHYRLPYDGPGATGLGKPLQSRLQASPDVPIYGGSITPAGLRTCAEIADGVTLSWMHPERFGALEGAIQAGFAKAREARQTEAGQEKTLAGFDVAPFVPVEIGPDLDKCRQPVKQLLAFYMGGMGARGRNFYNDYAAALGFPDAARTVQDLYLSGRRAEAVAAVPDAMVDECALVGPAERVRDRLDAWIEAGRNHHVGTLMLKEPSIEAMRIVAEKVLS